MALRTVDRMHSDFSALLKVLDDAQEISLRNTADDSLRKTLLLAAASYFERRMTDAVISFAENVTNNNAAVISFLRNKAVSRQYHTWFDWERNNANQFFALFGKDFREFMNQRIREDDDLAESIRAFMELGRDRNRLVHRDFASFVLEKTSEEIHDVYCKALYFVDSFGTTLTEFSIAAQSPSEEQGVE